ncbi:MAG: hypothetical protein ONB27_11745 [candidate division KSB1 bacterium]|nr:hypothetical protein [candidate division KSB1 bacterium]
MGAPPSKLDGNFARFANQHLILLASGIIIFLVLEMHDPCSMEDAQPPVGGGDSDNNAGHSNQHRSSDECQPKVAMLFARAGSDCPFCQWWSKLRVIFLFK